jgi:polyisoprenoid-binding protein YceI
VSTELRPADVPGYVVGTWEVGRGSSLEFSVKHMLVSRTRGRFTEFRASVVTPPDPRRASVLATIVAASFDTNDAGRDEATKGADWLAVDDFPTATYRSTRVRASGPGAVVVEGELTLRGITRPVDLHVEVGGFVQLPSGRTVAGFTGHAEINRLDFEVGTRVLMAAGGVMVGEKIAIDMEIEAVLLPEGGSA